MEKIWSYKSNEQLHKRSGHLHIWQMLLFKVNYIGFKVLIFFFNPFLFSRGTDAPWPRHCLRHALLFELQDKGETAKGQDHLLCTLNRGHERHVDISQDYFIHSE